MDRQQDVIRRITAHVTAYRFQLENERVERRKLMAIEIKGLRSDALLARANIDKVRAAYARFNAAAPAHADDVDKLASDITGMQSDLEFAATVMGNSADASEKLPAASVVRQNTQAGVGDLNQPKAAPEPTEGLQFALNTEPALGGKIDAAAEAKVTTDRVALGPHPDQPLVVSAAVSEAIVAMSPINDATKAELLTSMEVGQVMAPVMNNRVASQGNYK